MKDQKGITLIALVITIIVLLILAGVSIAMLTGDNGILTKAGDAGTKSAEAEIREAVKLVVAEIVLNQKAGESTDNVINKATIEKLMPNINDNVKVLCVDGSGKVTVTGTCNGTTLKLDVTDKGVISNAAE